VFLLLIKAKALFKGGVSTVQGSHGQKGFTLIEVLIGLLIFGAIGVTMMSGLFTGYRSLDISEERTFAESLAKSQVEYIKDQGYVSVIRYDAENPDNRYATVDISADMASAGYTVEIVPPEVAEEAGFSGYELQSIAVQVKRHNKVKFNITFYRVGLAL